MRLEVLKTVDDVAAGLFKFLGPADVVLLVKTGLELYQYGDLLAVLRRACKRRDDRRIAADTVQCLLDRENVGINCCGCNKLHDRIKGLIRMMHEDISFADLLEDIRSCGKCRNRLRLCVAVLSEFVKTLNAVRFHQISEVQRTVDLIDKIVLQGQLGHEELFELLIDPLFHFQTDRVAALALLELLLDLLEKIFRLVFRYIKIRAAHDPVGAGAADLIIDEQHGQIFADHIL